MERSKITDGSICVLRGVDMRRGTTPKLTFTLPFETYFIEDLVITFEQGGEAVLEKRMGECFLIDNSISVTLTQEETLLFSHEKAVKIQVKIKDTSRGVIASNIITKSCGEILNEEVL